MRDKKVVETAREMADLIRRFVSGDVAPYEWDDFMGVKFDDPFLEQMRVRSNAIADTSPPPENEGNDEGSTALLQVASDLEGALSNLVRER